MTIKYLQRVCHNIFCRIASSGANDILQRRTRYTHTCQTTFNLRIIEANIISTTLATTCLWLHKMIPHSFLFILLYFLTAYLARGRVLYIILYYYYYFLGRGWTVQRFTHTHCHTLRYLPINVLFPRLSCSLTSSLLLVVHERQFQRE